ncbi:MAG: hypothetical protein ABF270_04985, partial [Flavobacteriales bacterium]
GEIFQVGYEFIFYFVQNIPRWVVVLSNMKKATLLFLLIVTLFLFHKSRAQGFVCFDNEKFERVVVPVKDSSELVFQKNKIILELQSEGYISSWLRLNKISSDTSFYEIKKGYQYTWKSLTVTDRIPFGLIKKGKEKHITKQGISSVVSRVLSYCQDIGYPFVSCYFDSIVIENDSISGIVQLNLNQFIVFDSLEIKGGSSISHQTLMRLIGYVQGMPYRESYIEKLPSVLSSFPFLSMIRSPEVYFFDGKASLVLYLEEKKNNRFDGVIGINPDENSSGLEIVGEVNIELTNVFKRAESISLNWEKIKENSQRFKVGFDYPFLYGSKLGTETNLNYFRQDTSFANLDFKLGLSYFIDNYQSFKLGWNSINSNSLVQSVRNDLPSTNSFVSNYLSFGYESAKFNYRLNPRSGVGVCFTINSGFKKIDKNTDFVNSRYQDLEENTQQFRFDFELIKFLPLFKKATAMFKLTSGNIVGENIFLNELYQLGGLSSLRGFNQQSLFASNYYFLTTEYRYLFDRNSSVFAFVEGGFYESNRLNNYENGLPVGAGFGVNFATKSGVFTLTYALGKQNDNPVLGRNGKVHFGYISLF